MAPIGVRMSAFITIAIRVIARFWMWINFAAVIWINRMSSFVKMFELECLVTCIVFSYH